ncbi:MAG: V-type ATP synthase subunit A [Lentisphaeria bacterium]|nr:V-type ATP synthase subunit A [Lentisphaeria bacterium]
MEKSQATGVITGINGNMITVRVDGRILQNELAYVVSGDERLKAEIIKIEEGLVSLQVYESTRGLKAGDTVEFSGEMLFATLGPGILGQVYDGLQNPLHELAEKYGVFLQRGKVAEALDQEKKWAFTPTVKAGDKLLAGMPLGWVPENAAKHLIMAPFYLAGELTVKRVADAGDYTVTEKIAELTDAAGKTIPVTMCFDWPIKIPIDAYAKKLLSDEPMVTQSRIIDSFFPVALGGTYCVPGPFGAGKTVLQQNTSRNAQVDVVIVAACGERAGEVVETLLEFPEIIDPRTGNPLMDRTIIIANTSSMPVAAREASVYTAATLGEYYRQMGLNVLLMADSTSRWAQAMREVSGRLEEIPGDEAFPAYLESRIAEFYERSGFVELHNGEHGSLTIGGTVSPAGGNFEEPVTQATLKVVDAFHGLSRARSDARKYPAIDPLESWSHCKGIIDADKIKKARAILVKGDEVGQMMMVVGEDGTAMSEFITYLKADLLDSVYLQQDSFDDIDNACSSDRQRYVFDKVFGILMADLDFKDKADGRQVFSRLTQHFIDWNRKPMDSDEFKELEETIDATVAEAQGKQ